MAGDSALVAQFGDAIDPEINAHVKALDKALKENKVEGIVETVPTFRSLMIHYDPFVLSCQHLADLVKRFSAEDTGSSREPRKTIRIPVLFGGKWGPDLEHVAEFHHLTTEQVIQLTCSRDVLIYMLGFTPGNPYIGGMPEELITPRLPSPRLKVPEGSVGIGGQQLGVYAVESPGGYQLLGRTPIHVYDPKRGSKAVLLEAGEYIRFVRIDEAEYGKIAKEVAAGTYQYDIRIE